MNTYKLIKLHETESTNTYAKALLKNGEPSAPYTLIYTDKQTAGRGRLGRSWESAEGNTLCMSLVVSFPHNPCITLLAALGVHKALQKLTNAQLKIKWPNDLIYGNKKLCGILTESTDKYAIIGIGINLNTEQFSKDIAHKATSLRLITSTTYNPFETAKIISENVIDILEKTKGELSLSILNKYRNLCANIGREITFRGTQAVAVDIAPDGSLIAKTSEGTEYINSGEVTVSGIY